MPESTSLHIQDRESSQIRVVEIPWIVVRVGRAAYCEVRLPDGDLAEEACRLQRGGRGWHLIPLGPAGSILLQEQPVDGPHPLPFDVPFRVGSWSMTLSQSRPNDPQRDLGCTMTSRDRHWLTPAVTPPLPDVASELWLSERMTERPMPREVTPPLLVVTSELQSSEKMTERPMPPVVPESASKAALLAEAPTVAPEPGPVNPWEARWRAAGDRLRSTAKKSEKTAKPRSFRSPDRYQGVPLKAPEASLHQQEEPLASWSSRLPQEVPRATLAPEPFVAAMPLPPRFPVRPEPRDEPGALIEEVSQPEVTNYPVRAPEIVIPSAADEPSAAVRAPEIVVPSATDEFPIAAEIKVGSTENSASEPHAELQLPVAAHEAARVEIEVPQAEGQSSVSRFVTDTAWAATAGFLELGPLHATVSTTTEALWKTELRSRDWQPEASCQSRSPNPSVRSTTLPDPGLPQEGQHPRPAENPSRPGDSRQRPRSGPQPARPGPESDLPSAKDILAAVAEQASPQGKRPGSSGRHQATPTVSLEPGQWSAPIWLFWPPAVLLTLFLGITDFVLSWRWAGDAHCASVVARELLIPPANPGRVKPLPESVVPPEPSWWHTTPLHLSQWGVYLGRPGLEGNRTEEGRQLIDAAIQIVPLYPLARLSQAQVSARPGDPASLARHLGLSRDAASLAWSARALRLSGRKEAAVRVYRQALQLACRCDRSPSASLASSVGPAFDDDSRVRRYYLPGEATAREIVRELLADVGWSLQGWTEAVPRHSVATLAAARLLREQERPEAQKLLEEILASGTEDFQNGSELAIHMATRAEAFALLAQWREAQRQYQQAIDQIDDVTTRRCWWFNLASIALQLDDEAQRKAALQAALEVSASDDISRRALELQRASQSLGRLRPGVTKAN
ncbi:MAG TPA: hypothetical protein VJY33_23725 [Isosphaeraceae bacterium]|nr:hypothetical protein [Isosphaeraceae bacterium]